MAVEQNFLVHFPINLVITMHILFCPMTFLYHNIIQHKCPVPTVI